MKQKRYILKEEEDSSAMLTGVKTKISIVCPAFQEQDVLPAFYSELTRVLQSCGFDFEIIIVDDGSGDGTLLVLREIALSDPKFFYLSFSKNFGHQAAITAGLEKATGDVIITLDSDLQHPPDLIIKMLGLWKQGNDVVLSKRQDLPTGFSPKQFLRKVFFTLVGNGVESLKAEYSDYRLLSRRALDSLLQFKESHRYLRGLVSLIGYPTAVVSFKPAQRFAGQTKFGFLKLFSYALDAFFSFSKAPIKVIYGLSCLFLMLSVVCFGWFVVASYLGLEWGQRSSILMGSLIFFCSSGISFGQGICADYIGRIYEQVKNRPLFFVKETNID